ncbi:hypothetical protein [Micromonospora parathelypteridis]|uniref:Uncharacterized protein n=1 Tax=Micromonospora parathelypteridis TaxID=1839617 RepID=A0A840W997_9ACTN|nr:hypothetical protein [Micromonospora parathelypteridis]MBB5481588.1 hypothetical protein [Micromonospora parathelypteridis]GGO29136.1 hypothetical protein GCM10011576_55510 [Micromonospora parathelypteridis]
MTMNDSDVRGILHRATDGLVSPPGLLGEVRRGGRRRMVRRRAVLAAVCAAVVAVPVAGRLQLTGDAGDAPFAAPLLDEPTRGDLATDNGYLRQVRAAWQLRMKQVGDLARGESHIVWAGATPAGPAAYVAQRTAHGTTVGFVEPTADGPRVGTQTQVTDIGTDGFEQAALLGSQRDVLLVLDFGQPVQFSAELRSKPDGKVERTFTPVVFRDGAAVLSVPPQLTKLTVALSRTPVGWENMIHIDNAQLILFPGNKDRPEPPVFRHTLAGAEQVWGTDPAAQSVSAPAEALTGYIDPVGVHTHNGSPRLWVYGATPDGRRLLVETIQYDDEPSRVIALLARRYFPFEAVASTTADWSAPLPVRLRLPDNQGILVAAEGSALSYRVGEGQWQDAGRNAALLPATATEVRVTDANGTTTSVPTAS